MGACGNVPKHRARISGSLRRIKDGTVSRMLIYFETLFYDAHSLGLPIVFVCGNAGASPRHATLLAADVPPSMVVRILDRFLMYYIRTADKLMRTARWLENMEGGIEVGACSQLKDWFSY